MIYIGLAGPNNPASKQQPEGDGFDFTYQQYCQAVEKFHEECVACGRGPRSPMPEVDFNVIRRFIAIRRRGATQSFPGEFEKIQDHILAMPDTFNGFGVGTKGVYITHVVDMARMYRKLHDK